MDTAFAHAWTRAERLDKAIKVVTDKHGQAIGYLPFLVEELKSAWASARTEFEPIRGKLSAATRSTLSAKQDEPELIIAKITELGGHADENEDALQYKAQQGTIANRAGSDNKYWAKAKIVFALVHTTYGNQLATIIGNKNTKLRKRTADGNPSDHKRLQLNPNKEQCNALELAWFDGCCPWFEPFATAVQGLGEHIDALAKQIESFLKDNPNTSGSICCLDGQAALGPCGGPQEQVSGQTKLMLWMWYFTQYQHRDGAQHAGAWVLPARHCVQSNNVYVHVYPGGLMAKCDSPDKMDTFFEQAKGNPYLESTALMLAPKLGIWLCAPVGCGFHAVGCNGEPHKKQRTTQVKYVGPAIAVVTAPHLDPFFVEEVDTTTMKAVRTVYGACLKKKEKFAMWKAYSKLCNAMPASVD